jgi:hypothetical protein
MILFWLKKVDTSWAPVGGNKGAYFLQREIMWGLAQWKRTCAYKFSISVLSPLFSDRMYTEHHNVTFFFTPKTFFYHI